MKILITGGTGLIGKRLSIKLAEHGHDIYLVVREKKLIQAKKYFSSFKNITLFKGDITKENVLEDIQKIPDDIEVIIHLAAVYDLRVSRDEAYLNNVKGTENVIKLAKRLKHLKYFHHMSTYTVSPLINGEYQESELDSSKHFSDYYSLSKMIAERAVRHADFKQVKVRIYRPGIVIGDSKNGETDKIDGPYYFLRLFKKLSKLKNLINIPVLPIACNREATLPLIPVDVIVNWLSVMIEHPSTDLFRCYHLVPDEKIIIKDFVSQSLKFYDLNTKIILIPFPKIFGFFISYLGIPKEIVSYMQFNKPFSQKEIKKDFPNLKSPSFESYLPQILKNS